MIDYMLLVTVLVLAVLATLTNKEDLNTRSWNKEYFICSVIHHSCLGGKQEFILIDIFMFAKTKSRFYRCLCPSCKIYSPGMK